MFLLTDSRSRSADGKRKHYVFPSTRDGHHDVWWHVVMEECPLQWADYAYLASPLLGVNLVETFNDYWSCYGWYLVNADVADVIEAKAKA